MTLLDRIMTKASKSKDSNIEPFRYIYIYIFFFFFFSTRYTVLFNQICFCSLCLNLKKLIWSHYGKKIHAYLI